MTATLRRAAVADLAALKALEREGFGAPVPQEGMADELTRTWGVAFDTTSLPDVWAAVARFAPNVTGHVIADLTDGSVNAAVALCSAFGAIAVSARTAPRAAALGLPLISDARGRDLEWVLASLGTSRFSAKVSLIQDPQKTGMSDVAVAFNALPWYVADANASTGAAPRIWGALSPPFAKRAPQAAG